MLLQIIIRSIKKFQGNSSGEESKDGQEGKAYGNFRA